METGLGNKCPYCEMYHTGICPLISSIEYYENGNIKEVKFHAIETPKYEIDFKGDIKLANTNI